LDLGCGFGRTLTMLWENGSKNLIGLDINENCFNYIKSENPELYNGMRKYIGSIETLLPFMGRFDVIITFSFFIHIDPKVRKVIYDWIGENCKYCIFVENPKIKGKNKKLYRIDIPKSLANVGFGMVKRTHIKSKYLKGYMVYVMRKNDEVILNAKLIENITKNKKCIPYKLVSEEANYIKIICEIDVERLKIYEIKVVEKAIKYLSGIQVLCDDKLVMNINNIENSLFLVNMNYKKMTAISFVRKEYDSSIEYENLISIAEINFGIFQFFYKDVSSLKSMIIPNKFKHIFYLVPLSFKKNIKNYIDAYTSRKIIYYRHFKQANKIISVNNFKIIISESLSLSIKQRNIKINLDPNQTFYVIDSIFNEQINLNEFDKKMNYISTKKYGNLLIENGIDPSKIKMINGLPRFDHIFKYVNLYMNRINGINKKYNIGLSVFIICGLEEFSKDGEKNIINSIITTVSGINENYGLFIKLKKHKHSFSNDKIHILEEYEQSHNYYFCDVVVVVEYGISFIEALLYDPSKVILYSKQHTRSIANFSVNKLKNLDEKIRDRLTNSSSLLIQIAQPYIDLVVGHRVKFVSDIISQHVSYS
jgi:SAM-dependent methyltransferase